MNFIINLIVKGGERTEARRGDGRIDGRRVFFALWLYYMSLLLSRRAGVRLVRRITTPSLSPKVLAALDDHSDAQRVQLGRILNELQEMATGRNDESPGGVAADAASAPCAVTDQEDDALLKVNVNSPGAVSDTVAALITGDARLAPSTLHAALTAATAVLRHEPTVLDLTAADALTHCVGDLHGCGDSLARVLELCGPPSPTNHIVFNGDFVDRGTKGVEVLASLALLKACHPESVYLLRGNHEDELLSTVYGFKDELSDKYAEHATSSLWPAVVELFSHLPLAALVRAARARLPLLLVIAHYASWSMHI